MFAVSLILSFVSLSLVSARGINDWNKPCFSGTCSYDLPSSPLHRGGGSLQISGSVDAVSDITPAAGWTILNCSSTALSQDIRLVCSDGNKCNHLFRKQGAVGKLVRLPESCGKSAFARVAKYSVSKDQSIPSNTARSGSAQVISLRLDTNFAAIDPTVAGNVTIAIRGSTIPGAEGNFTITQPTQRRGLFSWIEDAWNDFNAIDASSSSNLTLLNLDKTFPIYSTSLQCAGPPPYTASLAVDVDTNAQAVLSFGLAAVGTIVPPEITEFGVFVGLDASLDAILGVRGDIAGNAGTGRITLYEYALAGLDFPGLLTLGPTFKIVGELNADFDVAVDLQAEVSYGVAGARIIFPPTANTASKGGYTPSSGPLKLSVSGSSVSSSTITALIGPEIDLSINALSGIATANVYLLLDATASVSLDLTASGSAGTSINTTSGTTNNSAAGSVSGCVSVDLGVGASVGADAKFFGLFDEGTKLDLFEKEWEVYSQCFANSTGIARRSIEQQRRGISFSCPASPSSALIKVA